jgi:hypothetical protein
MKRINSLAAKQEIYMGRVRWKNPVYNWKYATTILD